MLEIFYRSLCRVAKYSCKTGNLETHKITHLTIFCMVKKKFHQHCHNNSAIWVNVCRVWLYLQGCHMHCFWFWCLGCSHSLVQLHLRIGDINWGYYRCLFSPCIEADGVTWKCKSVFTWGRLCTDLNRARLWPSVSPRLY